MEKQRKKVPLWVVFAISGALSIIFFSLGIITTNAVKIATTSDAEKTLAFVIKNIDKHYTVYDEATGEYVKFSPEDYAKAITDTLLDDYSTYMSREELADTISRGEGNYYGLGIYLTGEDKVEIYGVMGNSPAEKAGIKKGDVIKSVKTILGEETFVKNYPELQSALENYGENEEFIIVLEDGKEITISKQAFIENHVWYKDSESSFAFKAEGNALPILTETNDKLETLPSDTAYIRLSAFKGHATSQFGEAYGLLEARGRTKLIIDLRGNGGGYVDIMEEIASYVVKPSGEGRTVINSIKYKDGTIEYFRTTANNYKEYEYFVLADQGSASASEALMGGMLCSGSLTYDNLIISKQTVDGEARTFGKGIMQSVFTNFVTGEAIKLTNAYLFWPNGETIHGKGIKTTEENSILISGILDVDNELARAIELAKN